MVRTLGTVWGILFIMGGVLGFVPALTKDQMFLGVFMVNTLHNLVHIASGVMFLLASNLGARAARLWFQIFGVFYAALAAIGFQVRDGMIFGLIPNNRYDSWGHALLALVLLGIGFATSRETVAA